MAGIVVLHSDRELLAVAKPPGRLVIPGRTGQEVSLREELEGAHGRLWVVHRLDRGTSGVLLFARTAAAHRTLNLAFDEGRPEKRYLALVRGTPPEAVRVDVALAKGRKGKVRPAWPGEAAAKPSATRFRRLEAWAAPGLGGPFAWVEALPETGRTHQIRVHLQSLGTPLAIDPDYGEEGPLRRADGSTWLERTPLHAESLRIDHPADGRPLVLKAPLPEDLAAALALLRGA
ncbi:MAG: RluA family pseudouridine synthase [Anaeromyxobacteraceae bacterium]